MTQPLNPKLYSALTREFGYVGIANEGQPAIVHRAPDYNYRGGKLSATVSEWGENYKVNCPLCSDTRRRLCICHLFGTIDPETLEHVLSPIKCHNEHCIHTRELQKRLYAMLFPHGSVAREVQPLSVPAVTATTAMPVARPIELPSMIPLAELNETHPAIFYLRHRGFDPAELSRVYGVGYCDVRSSALRSAYQRIVIPVFTLKEKTVDGRVRRFRSLAGYQARQVGDDVGDSPKYMTATGMKKSHLLYGLHHAVKTTGPVVVVVEGVTDAWSVGLNAVAIFGKVISQQQVKLIVRWLSGRPVVVMLDADAADEAARARDVIRRVRRDAGDRSPVVVATVPPDADPGELGREQIDEIIAAALGNSTDR